MEKYEYSVKIIDDFDGKEIFGNPFTLTINNSELSRIDRLFQLFLRKKDLHFRSVENLKKYIKKYNLWGV